MAYGSLNTDVIQSSTTGVAPQFKDGAGTQIGTLCRAWVNFSGATSTGTIRASFNVSSVTKNGAGDYTVNFTNAMPDVNYVLIGAAGDSSTSLRTVATNYAAQAPTTTSARIQTPYANATVIDIPYANIAIFR